MHDAGLPLSTDDCNAKRQFVTLPLLSKIKLEVSRLVYRHKPFLWRRHVGMGGTYQRMDTRKGHVDLFDGFT
jgi:hypothetical protein